MKAPPRSSTERSRIPWNHSCLRVETSSPKKTLISSGTGSTAACWKTRVPRQRSQAAPRSPSSMSTRRQNQRDRRPCPNTSTSNLRLPQFAIRLSMTWPVVRGLLFSLSPDRSRSSCITRTPCNLPLSSPSPKAFLRPFLSTPPGSISPLEEVFRASRAQPTPGTSRQEKCLCRMGGNLIPFWRPAYASTSEELPSADHPDSLSSGTPRPERRSRQSRNILTGSLRSPTRRMEYS